jgi:hypothetical protein
MPKTRRMLYMSFVTLPIPPSQSPTNLMSRNLEPGGYVQQIEIEIKPQCDDGTLPANNIFQRCADIAKELSGGGPAFIITGNIRPQMEAAGFVDIVERRYKVPLGPWSSNPIYQDLGYYFEMFWRTGCHGWLMGPATRALGVSVRTTD